VARQPASTAARDGARDALDAWRAELVYSYPAQGERLYEAHLGTVGTLLPYAYPLVRIPVEASRAVAVHSAFVAEVVKAEVPQARSSTCRCPRAPSPSIRTPCARYASGSASGRTTSWWQRSA